MSFCTQTRHCVVKHPAEGSRKMSNQRNIQNIIELLERDDSIDAPAESIKWAKNLFAVRAAESKIGILQRIKAHLNVDLSPGVLIHGERSATASSVRQMLFEAGDIAVDLRITKTGRAFDIKGQILGDGFMEGTISFISREGKEVEFPILESSFESFGIRSADYQVIIRGTETEIVIESVNI